MPRVNKTTAPHLLAALALAATSAACLTNERNAANNGCEARYVGRQKAACEKGVTEAYEIAKKQDGKSHSAKYDAAVGKCQKIEPPLVLTRGRRSFERFGGIKLGPDRSVRAVLHAFIALDAERRIPDRNLDSETALLEA